MPLSADFWASYASGAIGICIGNPLDVLKVQLQASGEKPTLSHVKNNATGLDRVRGLLRGAAPPILAYGALNSLLYMTYNRALKVFHPGIKSPTCLENVPLAKVWVCGMIGGVASWTVSAPSELVKCRVQLSSGRNSFQVLREIYMGKGLFALYRGGTVTLARDSIGYGFYFAAYEQCRRVFARWRGGQDVRGTEILLSGGVAGIVSWVSIYPLDVIKTRVQAGSEKLGRVSVTAIARQMLEREGGQSFYRGLGVCSARAFVVNALQWYVYEKAMSFLDDSK